MWASAAAAGVLLGWAATGPVFHFSDTWPLVINTGTPIVTFLTVFLIQSPQNRDARAVHLTLDELLRVVHAACTSMVELEDRSDAELDRRRDEFQRLREHAEREAELRADGEDWCAGGRRLAERVRG